MPAFNTRARCDVGVTRARTACVGAAVLMTAVCAATAASAQSTAPRRWAHEFTNVAAACERSDGSVIATDAGDPSIVLLGADGNVRPTSSSTT